MTCCAAFRSRQRRSCRDALETHARVRRGTLRRLAAAGVGHVDPGAARRRDQAIAAGVDGDPPVGGRQLRRRLARQPGSAGCAAQATGLSETATHLVAALADQRLGVLANSSTIHDLPPVLEKPLSEPLFILGTLFVLLVFFVPCGLASLGHRLRRVSR